MNGLSVSIGPSSPLNRKIERRIAEERAAEAARRAENNALREEIKRLKEALAREVNARAELAQKWAAIELERADKIGNRIAKDREAGWESDGFLVVTLANIVEAVTELTGFSEIELKSSRRAADVVQARQVAIFCGRELTLKSLPTLGRFFHRDHTTALHSVQKVADRMKSSPEVAKLVEEVMLASRRIAIIANQNASQKARAA